MSNKGFSHIGLSTHDLDATMDFYENILGFKVVRCDTIKIRQGGNIRHAFIDVGRDQLVAFMEPNNVPGLPDDFDTGINRGLGIPGVFLPLRLRSGQPARAERQARGATGQRRQSHRHRRPRVGHVHLF